MVIDNSAVGAPGVPASATAMNRVALGCFIGSAIEFYDFYIYGTAAALVFPAVFFPHLNPALAAVASMGTFAAAFLSRPLGGVVFGHFGDRLGRKTTLVATLLIMGVSTVAVGLVPGTATIGIAAPLLVLALRLLQGFAVGGEWAGSALMSTEYAPEGRRGHYGKFTAVGVGAALVLSSLTFLGVSATIGVHSPAFMSWGWRVPFLLSAVLVAVAVYIRLNIEETPVFAAERARPHRTGTPLAELSRRQRRTVALATGSFVGVFGFVFMASVYLASYASRLGYSRDFVLLVGVLGGLTWIVVAASSAGLCDRLGRRRVITFAWVLGLPWSAAAIWLIESGRPVLFGVAVVGVYAVAAAAYGPMTAFIPELFATRYRYTGSGLALNLAGLVGGALPPVLAGPLSAHFGSPAIGVMMAGLALVSLMCTYRLPETRGTSLVGTR